MSQPLGSVSVVVPCFNAARWIGGALSSVYLQDWPEPEVLVVDDGSSDHSVTLVREQFPRAKLLQQRNRGAAAARNAGLEKATGDWVAFLDADDYWLPGKLRAQMELLAAHPEARMACTGWAVWPSTAPLPLPEELDPLAHSANVAVRAEGPSGWIYPELLLGCCVWTSTVLARRDLLVELEGFDCGLKVGEDYDLWLRASRLTPILRVGRPLALYRQHPASLTRQAPAENYEAKVVERAVQRWGYASPDGRSVRKSDVSRSLARSWRDFAEANLSSGKPDVGMRAAHLALTGDWRHFGAWKLMGKALAHVVRRAR